MPRITIALLSCLLVLASSASAQAVKQKPVIASDADLPRFSYPLEKKPSAILDDNAAFDHLAAKLRGDTESLLVDYDIRDDETRR